MRHHRTPTRKASSKGQTSTRRAEDMENRAPPKVLAGKRYGCSRNQSGTSSNAHTVTVWPSNSTRGCRHARSMSPHVHTGPCAWAFSAASFVRAKGESQPNSPSAHTWLNKLWGTDPTMEYHTSVKRSKTLTCATTWMNLEHLHSVKKSATQDQAPLIRRSRTGKPTETGSWLVVSWRGWGRGRMRKESKGSRFRSKMMQTF